MKATRFALWRSLAAAGLALLLDATSGLALALTRGPYIQKANPHGVTLRWRTDVATNSVVRYGVSPGDRTHSAMNAIAKTEHEVTLRGLRPGTLYYYSVGSSSRVLAGGDRAHSFETPPPVGTRTSTTRIWVIGDSGTADWRAAAVRDAYFAYPGSASTDVWLMLGDNAYNDGTDAEFQAAVFDMYPSMLRRVAVWPTFGNHEAHTASSTTQTGPYFDIFSLPKLAEAGGLASGTEAYYSFDFANIHFICLDSQGRPLAAGGGMLTWLEADLASTNQDWIVAYWHHPPYSKGSHDSDVDGPLITMRQLVVPVLERHGVDLVLSGHSHSYERSMLLDGHYGSSATLTPAMILDGGDGDPQGDGPYEKGRSVPAPHDGTVYTVAGSSGGVGGGTYDHPVMVVSLAVLGSLVLDVAGSGLDARFLDSSGMVRDRFAIQKPVPGAPSCLDAIDNDRDGSVDASDMDCRFGSAESVRMCGLGFELALVIPLLARLARRRCVHSAAPHIRRSSPSDLRAFQRR